MVYAIFSPIVNACSKDLFSQRINKESVSPYITLVPQSSSFPFTTYTAFSTVCLPKATTLSANSEHGILPENPAPVYP